MEIKQKWYTRPSVEGAELNKRERTQLLIAFLCTGCNVFITVTSLNNILPVLAEHFGVTSSDMSLITVMYSLVVSGLGLPFGRLGDRIGYDKVFILGNVLFTISTVLSGIFTQSLGLVMVMRMLMGIGASMVQSISQILMIRSMPAKDRGKAMSINNTLVSATSIVAPILGSFICDSLGWRVSLVMMLPFGVAAIILNARFIRKFKGFDGTGNPDDLLGTVLFSLFLIPLMLFFNKYKLAWLTDTVGVIFLAVSVASLIGFILWENRVKYPLMRLTLFKDMRFTLASIGVLCCYIATNASHIALPFYLQSALGMTATTSSYIAVIFNVVMVIFISRFGIMADKIGATKLSIGGMAIMLVAMVMIVFYRMNTSLVFVIVSQALQGVGSAMFMTPTCSVIMGVTPKEDSGLASAMISTMRNLAGAVSGTLYTVIIAMRTVFYEAAGVASDPEVYVCAQSDFSKVNVCLVAGGLILMILLRLAVKKRPAEGC